MMSRGTSTGTGTCRARRSSTPRTRDSTYTVTDHGEPIAEIAARRQPRWIPGDEIDSVWRELGADEAWDREIAAERAAVDVVDPWERLE